MEVALVMYKRALREAKRIPITTVIIPLVLPLFMVTIFAHVFARITSVSGFRSGSQYVAYVAPATILMASMLGSATAAVSTAVEIQTGFFDRMRTSPAGAVPSMLARRFADATRLAVFAIILALVAWAEGMPISNWFLGLLVAAALAALWGLAYGGLALAACVRTGSAELANALLPLFFPILFMSTAFVPLPLLPHWLQGIARWNPASYIADAIRVALIQGRVDGGTIWRAALGIFCVALATQFLIWRAGQWLGRR